MDPTKKSFSFLYLCGIFATALYIATDIICSINYPGYSYADQAISELSAIGAPTSELWQTLMLPYSALVVLFGFGVFSTANRWQTNASAIFFIIFGMSGYAWLFVPMNQRGNIGSATDTGHQVMSGITVFLLSALLVFGSFARGTKFKIYSFVTLATMLFFGFLVGLDAPKVAANQPTPWMGIFERMCVYTPMIWTTVFAVMMIKERGKKRNRATQF